MVTSNFKNDLMVFLETQQLYKMFLSLYYSLLLFLSLFSFIFTYIILLSLFGTKTIAIYVIQMYYYLCQLCDEGSLNKVNWARVIAQW